jgi:threonine dehydrogenase-like Zn-dependent dehydrogenase
MASLSFALIGCGPMGRGLADALKQVPEARVVAVADPLEEARQQAAEAYGAEAYADYGCGADDVGSDRGSARPSTKRSRWRRDRWRVL